MTVVFVASAGCAAANGSIRGADRDADADPAERTDAGTIPPTPEDDAGGPRADAGPSVEAEFDGVPADPSRGDVGAGGELGFTDDQIAARRSCYDGEDNDDDVTTPIDCAFSACRPLASCCVDDANCCAPVAAAPLPATVDMDCTGCALFGDPQPFVDEGLAMGGDAEFDSGAVIGSAVDLTTHSVTLSMRFGFPATCEDGCLESTAVGFTAQPPTGERDHVHPLVALQLAPARRAVQLLVGDAVAARFDAGAEDDEWDLELRADGGVEVRHAGATVSSGERFVPVDRAHLVVYGHSRNPDLTDGPGARLRALQTEVALCEMPRAWAAREEVALLHDESIVVGDVRGTSVARHGGQTWVALETRNGVHVGELVDGALALLPATLPSLPTRFSPPRDPALVHDGTTLALLFSTDVEGRTEMRRASWDGGAFALDEDPWIASTSLPAGFANPSVLVHESHEIVVAESDAGLTLLVRGPKTRGAWQTIDAFPDVTTDAEHPSLLLHGPRYEVHYAWRRGSRGVVGLLASDELLAWRHVADEVLGRSERGFDRLGVAAPAAYAEGDEIVLFYAGEDGMHRRLGTARRRATRRASP